MTRIALVTWAGSLLFVNAALAQPAAAADKDAKPTPSQEELEKQFAEKMTGATMVGRFTTGEVKNDQPLSEDRYTLGKVFKLKNGMWQFETRIQYNGKDIKVPLAVEVKWAGDTPVITVTDLAVPGSGTFNARVLIYKDQYAGTWSGGDHGGQMFGKIVKGEAAPEKPAGDAK